MKRQKETAHLSIGTGPLPDHDFPVIGFRVKATKVASCGRCGPRLERKRVAQAELSALLYGCLFGNIPLGFAELDAVNLRQARKRFIDSTGWLAQEAEPGERTYMALAFILWRKSL